MKEYKFNFPFGIPGGNGYEDYIKIIADTEDEAKDIIIQHYPKVLKNSIGKGKVKNIEKGIIYIGYDYP